MSSFEKIEILFSEDPGELVALWYWDWANGRDVIGVLLENGNVRVKTYDDDAKELGHEEITVLEFFKRIKNVFETREL